MSSSQRVIQPTITRTNSHAVPAPIQYLAPPSGNAPFAPGRAPQPLGSNRKKSSSRSHSRPGKQLSKSPSIPHLRGFDMSDADLDKKRSKLGYQRISIACAHCRRRKIRCLVAEDVQEQRCQNCIRLKKECVFYPVDQQAAIDARTESSNRTGAPSGPSSTVSSSPATVGTRTFEQQQPPQFGGVFPNRPPESPAGYQGVPIAPNTIPTQGDAPDHLAMGMAADARTAAYAPPSHGYAPHGATWSPQEYGGANAPMPVGGPSSMHQPYPRYGHPGMAADTAPFPRPGGPPHHGIPPPEQLSYNPEQIAPPWHQQQHPPQPVRSMSVPDYANHSFHPSYQPNPTLPPPQTGSYLRHPAQQHQPPDPRMAPGPAVSRPGPPPGQHYPYIVAHDSHNPNVPIVPSYPPSHDMHGNWYSSAPSYPPVGEEAHESPERSDQSDVPTRPK